MTKYMKNSIEYYGLTEEIPRIPDLCCFKQSVVSGRLKLPDSKPEISQILKVTADAAIDDTRIVFTPEATSFDGQIMTGRKMIVDGKISLWIEYAGDAQQTLYAVEFNIPFVSSIVLPEHYNRGMSTVIVPYIEDLSVSLMTEKTIYYNSVILVVLEY